MALIRTLMTPDPLVLGPDATAAEAAREMARRGVGAVLVAEEGRLWGVFTERDLLSRVVAEGRDPAATTLRHAATQRPAAVEADASLSLCAQILDQRGFRHLPVVDSDRRPVGVVSSRDFLRYVVGELEALVDRELLRGEGAGARALRVPPDFEVYLRRALTPPDTTHERKPESKHEQRSEAGALAQSGTKVDLRA